MTPELSAANTTLVARCEAAHQVCVQQLLDARTDAGHWVGRLSTSSLSTATAVSALSLYLDDFPEGRMDRELVSDLIAGGAGYLLKSQNSDGGWGDTDKSYSNIATTYLGWAALHLVSQKQPELIDREKVQQSIDRAKSIIENWGGIAALRKRYGKDKTFVVPILTNCALAGIVPWKQVSALPFEMAWVPQRFYRFMQMPVVSYAVPALVAIGQAKFMNDPPALPWRWVRRAAIDPTLDVLSRMQPASGGYLEAAPLTSFVAMSLAATGRGSHPVTVNAIQFLIDSVLDDGSWPIDTNLATWVTSLSINALAAGETELTPQSPVSQVQPSAWQWLLDCQYDEPHPFTGADPGGWGWTDLSGSVPDADDTPGALLSLFVAARLQRGKMLRLDQVDLQDHARRGIVWLLDLQNSDGGWPTFCRGWGKLPFDRSGVDLTAHAIRALLVWNDRMDGAMRLRIEKAVLRGVGFILKCQRGDGSWLPLWFGNQDQFDDENPVYGISKVLQGLLAAHQWLSKRRMAGSRLFGDIEQACLSGVECLSRLQNSDGGWGGGASVSDYVEGKKKAANSSGAEYSSSIEETALAVECLSQWMGVCQSGEATSWVQESRQRIAKNTALGVDFLCQRIEEQEHRISWPIGFYFAKLWYHEELYPLIFTVAALGKWRSVQDRSIELAPLAG